MRKFWTKVRTSFRDGSVYEGDEIQTALVCAFTADFRGGIVSVERLESIEIEEEEGDANESSI